MLVRMLAIVNVSLVYEILEWGHSGLCITGRNVSASCHSVQKCLVSETKPVVCGANLAAKNCPMINLNVKKYWKILMVSFGFILLVSF